MPKTIKILILLLIVALPSIGQITFSGTVKDLITNEPLSFVNIGIKHKNIGTNSLGDGTFSISIPQQNENDTLTFSMIGYSELNLPIKSFQSSKQKIILLNPKATQLTEVSVSTKRLVEKKIGIVKYNPTLHITDGSTNQNDIFEIAQLIKLESTLSKITSVNLYINESNKDSATFRINFYAFDGERPTEKIIEKSIIQTHEIKEGWLKFDMTPYNVYLKGNVVVSIEFIPTKKKQTPIYYEVKIGGSSKSFVRTSSLGEWSVPPHHYRLYVTALGEADGKKNKAESALEENETAATARLFSEFVKDSFSIFVSLPRSYNKNTNTKFSTAYILDANVYYDIIGNSIKSLNKNKLLPEMILVGIGYKDFFTMDSLRNRDYTFPKALAVDSFPISGGADKFLSFIEKELIPYIDKKYQTDTTNRTIMGHSLGGYFTLFALENDSKTKNNFFKNYVSASPSLDYCNEYIIKEFQNYPVANNDKNLRSLFLTTGGLEGDEINFNSFIKLLADPKFKNIRVQSENYPRYDHMETAIPTFEKGLQLIFLQK
ncbi:MAG: putative alpha/beta superfamily hydrolase [Bacteroidetes bacterium]|nr:putative alpha/beta superfamily hydrolase [Bacteroidota bacterium]